MLHVYYGTGKGKTSTAYNLALRQLAINHKVLILVFLKDVTSGDLVLLKKLGAKVIGQKIPDGIIDLCNPNTIKTMMNEVNQLFDRFDENYDCLIFDEIFDALTLQFINEDKVYQTIKKLKDDHEIVMTGRTPTQKFRQLADYVTEMKKHKHPFDQDIMARKGVEF